MKTITKNKIKKRFKFIFIIRILYDQADHFEGNEMPSISKNSIFYHMKTGRDSGCPGSKPI
jgi:hypothetical protein